MTNSITFINTFHTKDRSDQEQLAKAIRSETETVVRLQPGFLSATLYFSLDGKTLTNVARWTSAQAFREAISKPEMLAFREKTKNQYQPIGYLCAEGVPLAETPSLH